MYRVLERYDTVLEVSIDGDSAQGQAVAGGAMRALRYDTVLADAALADAVPYDDYTCSARINDDEGD